MSRSTFLAPLIEPCLHFALEPGLAVRGDPVRSRKLALAHQSVDAGLAKAADALDLSHVNEAVAQVFAHVGHLAPTAELAKGAGHIFGL